MQRFHVVILAVGNALVIICLLPSQIVLFKPSQERRSYFISQYGDDIVCLF